jgi:hypothetical protein
LQKYRVKSTLKKRRLPLYSFHTPSATGDGVGAPKIPELFEASERCTEGLARMKTSALLLQSKFFSR